MCPSSVTGDTLHGGVSPPQRLAARGWVTLVTLVTLKRAHIRRENVFQINIAGNSPQPSHCYHGSAGWRP
jgi:hypothetical protein